MINERAKACSETDMRELMKGIGEAIGQKDLGRPLGGMGIGIKAGFLMESQREGGHFFMRRRGELSPGISEPGRRLHHLAV